MKRYTSNKELASFYKTTAWKKMRLEILKRDNNECQMCKDLGIVTIDTNERTKSGRKKAKLIVHHIKELEFYPELALVPNNLTTVCWEHHEEIHERWKFFKPNKWKDDEKF